MENSSEIADQPQVLDRPVRDSAGESVGGLGLRAAETGGDLRHSSACRYRPAAFMSSMVLTSIRARDFCSARHWSGITLHEVLPRHPDRLIDGEVGAIIIEHAQIEFADLRIRRIHVDDIHRVLIDGLVGEAVLHAVDVRGRQREVVRRGQPRPAVCAIHELVTEGGPHGCLQTRQVADGAQVVLRGQTLRLQPVHRCC